MTRAHHILTAAIACAVLSTGISRSADAQSIRPYILASEEGAGVADVTPRTRSALTEAGFDVVGEYAFSPSQHIIVVSSNALRAAAAKTADGGFGAVVRVSVTRVGNSTQVAYVNPVWSANVNRLGEQPRAVAEALERALGRREEFGSRTGFPAAELRRYHYMAFMPYFNDQVSLGGFASRAAAVAKLEAGLAASSNAKLIYRVEIPGTEQTLFGVAILSGAGADTTVMRTTDTAARRHTAHLPYEVLVSGGRVTMLHGRFRIAQSFPDLTMGTFMKISGAPDGIATVLAGLVK